MAEAAFRVAPILTEEVSYLLSETSYHAQVVRRRNTSPRLYCGSTAIEMSLNNGALANGFYKRRA